MKTGLVGRRLNYSYSKVIHERFFGYSYELTEVPTLDDFVETNTFDAYNVTIPYKREIAEHLQSLSPIAKETGSVNTVVKRDGELFGYNTDVFGMEYALRKAGISLEDKKVVIFGNGGTASTAKVVAKRGKAREVVTVGRTSDNNYLNLYLHSSAEILINATPVGTYPGTGVAPIPSLSIFPEAEGVLDCIYNPLESRLLCYARERGVRGENGLRMLVAQAWAAQELFKGNVLTEPTAGESVEADGEIERIVAEIKREKKNVILVGMPGCGKTAVGKALAEAVGRSFVDVDGEIEKEEGATVAEIFERKGEEYFRSAERRLISTQTRESGLVIATGGGAVLDEENRRNIKQNATVIYLTRGLEKLDRKGRPLSINTRALERLQQERKRFYEEIGDFVISNDGDIATTVKRITDKL